MEHLRSVYGTLAIGLMAATVGAFLHLFTDFLRANFLLTLASIVLMIALSNTPHNAQNERKRLIYFLSFCALGGIISAGFLFILVTAIFSSSPFMHTTCLWMAFAINCALVLYDTQLICEKRRRGDTDYIWHTIELFIDFINLFRYVLVILSDKKEKSRKRND
ncbi:unnamed protein product [Gongylonema pulchrum]|uniref:Bax inhibitor 1 n=1 Tax=Gongylonema pulchrum TaxID=637853 RepID=A0A183E7V2_9BILA|nr:unnamed protein product [Gongylonema pulchrum]